MEESEALAGGHVGWDGIAEVWSSTHLPAEFPNQVSTRILSSDNTRVVQ